MTPICAFNLNARPLILPAESIIEISLLPDSRSDGTVSLDGNTEYILGFEDRISITISDEKVYRIVSKD